MPASKQKIKIPTKEGLGRARKKLKQMLRKEPSPELVKIIDEVTRSKFVDDDIAAKPWSSDTEV